MASTAEILRGPSPSPSSGQMNPRVISLHSTKAGIVKDRFIIQSQHCRMLPLTSGVLIFLVEGVLADFCCHVQTKKNLFHSSLSKRTIEKLEFGKWNGRKQFANCTLCHTNFYLIYFNIHEKGSSTILTRWMDLWHGMMPTDPTWRTHLNANAELEYPHSVFAS